MRFQEALRLRPDDGDARQNLLRLLTRRAESQEHP
jgi:hypothetical protein